MTQFWIVGPIAIAWYSIPDWFVRKWHYEGQSSWRHGSAQLWRFRIYW